MLLLQQETDPYWSSKGAGNFGPFTVTSESEHMVSSRMGYRDLDLWNENKVNSKIVDGKQAESI